MKKIFSFIVGLVAFTSLQAASYTEAARITMTCEGGSESQELVLIVDPAQASPATVANLASTYEVGQVNLYASYENGQFSSFKANAISNLPVVVVTNRRDDDYTFTFNVPISTEGLVLTDLRSDDGIKNIPMVNNGSYTFSVAGEANYAANTNVTIADRFVINYQAPTCTTVRNNLVANRYYTICLDQEVVSANGASFWSMQYRNAEGTLAYLVEEQLPLVAGRPYFFQAEAEELCVELSGDPVNGPSAFGALHGTFTEMNQAALTAAGTDIYLLNNNELWLVSGQEDNLLPANRAYVVYSDLVYSEPNPAPGRRVRAMPMQANGATGIENIKASEAPAKMIIDGKMYILRGEQMFDATGRLVK